MRGTALPGGRVPEMAPRASGPPLTARCAGGPIGAAVDHAGLPPVTEDASLSIGLENLAGKASFVSARVRREGRATAYGPDPAGRPVG